ncbi:endonuclease/exonuclease/phosphatase family protein [Algoriphagus terrigena]|uniref:endonuclease/exonuclease/phosphatase family protein n=1 Tax=Algoriphagus terrigena TaxID=344884 RepID=UPI0004277FE8|nr:endonuclease/exonuclease/phosphatase family protein [Algoriphagus terrigena]
MLFLKIVTVFFIASAYLPLIKWDHWSIRIFDYPRFQKLIIHLLLILAWWIFGERITENLIWTGLLGIGAIYIFTQVYPYTVFGKKMIQKVAFERENGLHVIVANVYQYNQHTRKLLDLIRQRDPDLVFLVETNQEWVDQLKPLEERYPHRILCPLENTYGLAFYSKFPMVSKKVLHLIDEEIPSLEVDLRLRSGKIITVYAIHPTPPVPNENPTSTDRDAEILIVGKKSKANPKPSLVIGDLNDVAWSYTTSLFLKTSELADPRRGRGFFSTFHAKVPLFRWPLDHVFLSKHFGLSSIKVLRGIGSDHFPIEMKATLTSHDTTDTETATSEEAEEAEEKIASAQENQKADQD